MNKTAIKNFAIWARVQLIEAAKQRAFEYEISECGENKTDIETVGGRLLSKSEKRQRNELISQIRSKGFNQVMEEAAYTWFNRFIALRYMEVNGYLPTKTRLFTDESGAFKPEILKEAINVDLNGIDRSKVIELIDKQDNEGLYKYLLITQCNALNSALPGMFEKIENWTELLFPANLLRTDSVLARMVSDIPEEDWTDQVQIIGWLYQYYNAEPKDKVFENLKKNIKISKENIPAATQLFTPDWIVRYMVENSLGRLWVEGHPNDELKANWKYYLEEAEQEPEVQAQLAEIRKEYAALKPEDIKVIDPCMGSGHILVYMFDVLVQIYESYGYNAREAAGLILQNNLYGLDIDERAAQLAYFAVMMKARQYDRRIFDRGIQPHVYAIVESNGVSSDILTYFENGNDDLKKAMDTIVRELHDAKEYGSILNVTQVDFAALYARLDGIKEDISLFATAAQSELRPLIEVAETMARKYHTVVTNPPYMGIGNMGVKLYDYIQSNYGDFKQDLYCVFIKSTWNMLKASGYQAMIVQQSFMFNSRFEKLRLFLISNQSFLNMAYLGTRAFDDISGEKVRTCSFVARRGHSLEYVARYVDLQEDDGEEAKNRHFLSVIENDVIVGRNNCYVASLQQFQRLEDTTFSFWISNRILALTDSKKRVSSYADTRHGLVTGNGEKFMRLWHECGIDNLSVFSSNVNKTRYCKWFPYNKGGSFRRWYGNREYVVNWENDGFQIRNYSEDGKLKSSNYNLEYNYKENISWSDIKTGNFAARFTPPGSLFDTSGPSLFVKNSDNTLWILAMLNTKVAQIMLDISCTGLHYSTGAVANIPVMSSTENNVQVSNITAQCIEISLNDWDSFEISWDFKQHPLISVRDDLSFGQFTGTRREKVASQLSECFREWESQCSCRFYQLKANEEELNRIFIDIYGLQDELTPEVDEKDVTVRKADLGRDIRSLISYAVGCMFGRYSLGYDGLAYAGGEWDVSKYQTFIPDTDNIIPICDDEYFADDITGRFIQWVEKVYGRDTLVENLKFIADALGGKGTPKEVIRSYFLNDFYVDHLKTYQKRPIYWLFSSGKKNGFKALIYMHRYQPDLLARMRTDYVHEQQERYRTQIQMLEESAEKAAPSERVKLNKQIAKLKDQELEIRQYEEKIHHLADQMIAIDLDDGVKVNYAKFADVLEKIK